MAAQHLQNVPIVDGLSLGDTIIFGVTTTTFFVQLLGPQLVKWSIHKAKENGKNITEEDILQELLVRDVLEDPKASQVEPTATIRDIFTKFSGGADNTLVVCDNEKHVAGIITFEQLRASMMDADTWDWIIAADVAAEPIVKLSTTDTLLQAVRTIRQINVQELVVFDEQSHYAGLCRYSAIMRAVRRKMIRVPEPAVAEGV
jgi:signal-transduction protein with cAMP-binding, CBS, and nucleotidyltransferase domain